MTRRAAEEQAEDGAPGIRAYAFNGRFHTSRHIRRILELSGYPLHLGLPGPQDVVAVWGRSPTAWRGERIAARRGAGLLRVEDAFVRSLHPGRGGEAPLGLLIDPHGVHFDPSAPSLVETILNTDPLDDTALLDRARDGMARLREGHIAKFSGFDPAIPAPRPGYVLVVDQTRGDASVAASGADRARFLEMLTIAREEHPGARVLIAAHPETRAGHRPGHFRPDDADDRVSFFNAPVSPWHLLEGAVGVYTVSSQLGFEAILAGHRPRVFGQPFYAGWGLTEDERPHPRRQRKLTRAQLFAGAMILAPAWYDPFRDRLCEFETALDILEAEVRRWRDDRRGWVAFGMRAWKRPHLRRFFGTERRMIFATDPERAETSARRTGRRLMAWGEAARETPTAVAVEDGFLRSRGLGAELVPPLSLVLDDLGIHSDPSRPSRLERLIERRAELRADQRRRAEALIGAIRRHGLSKYNTGGDLPGNLPAGRRILVPGQVEDDAAVVRGAGRVRGNLALLEAVRAANPEAVLIYKPHPDVEAGLRPGALAEEALTALVDVMATAIAPDAILGAVDEVWTITSLTGFEALLRGLPVTTLGAPFYAGWGLTRDLGPVPPRRRARVSLAGLVHAALIDYPRYLDPLTGRAAPPEVIVERLAAGVGPRRGPLGRLMAAGQRLRAGIGWRG